MNERPVGEVLNWYFTEVGVEVECAVCPLGALGWGLTSRPKSRSRADESRVALWDYALQHLALAHGVHVAADCPPLGSSKNFAGRNGPPFTHPDDESARARLRKVGANGRPAGDSVRPGEPAAV